jgi:hypothetical protein
VLLLRGRQSGIYLGVGVGHNGATLLENRLGIEACIGVQIQDAPIAIGEDGLNLRCLVGGKAELLRECFGLAVGTVRARLGCGRLRCGCGPLGE